MYGALLRSGALLQSGQKVLGWYSIYDVPPTLNLYCGSRYGLVERFDVACEKATFWRVGKLGPGRSPVLVLAQATVVRVCRQTDVPKTGSLGSRRVCG